jgi:hypothetical protein
MIIVSMVSLGVACVKDPGLFVSISEGWAFFLDFFDLESLLEVFFVFTGGGNDGSGGSFLVVSL